MVRFDMDDPSTHASALEGAYGLFVVTNYWEHFSVDKEKQQAKSIADAAKAAGVHHIIWSTLEGTGEFFDSLPEEERPNKLEGGYYVPHFDGKHEGDQYFPADKTTKLFTSFYLDNFMGFGMVRDGILCNNMGDAPLPVIAAEDIGKCAYGIFKAGHKYMGKDVYIAGSVMTCENLMSIASDVTGQEFEYRPVDRETYASFDFPGANDLANMFYFKAKNKDFSLNRNPANAKALNPDLQTARVWMEKNVDVMNKLAKPVPEQAMPAAGAKKAEAAADLYDESPAVQAPESVGNSEEMWA